MIDLYPLDEPTLLRVSTSGPGAVDVCGELDIATGPLLTACVSEHLADARCRSVRLNLSDVVFIDCSGLGALLTARGQALSLGKEIVIDRAGARVRQFLERTGTSRVLLRQ